MPTASARLRLGRVDWAAPPRRRQAVREYLEMLDDAAFGAATPVAPKFVSHVGPGRALDRRDEGARLLRLLHQLPDRSRPRGHRRCRGDRAIRQAEVGAARTMIERTRGPLRPLARSAWPPTLPTARPRSSPGWSTSAGSSRTSRCSTSPSAATAPSSATTSPMTAMRDAYICPAGKELRQSPQPFERRARGR